MYELIVLSILIILIVFNIIQFFIIKGFLSKEKETIREPKNLSAKEIELIKQKVIIAGINAISKNEIFDIIYSFKNLALGTYTEDKFFIPANPYENIEDKIIPINTKNK